MTLLLFRSLWTNSFNLDAALADCQGDLFDGVEGPVPSDVPEQRLFCDKLGDAGVPFIGEICTGGSYVPDRNVSIEAHLADFQRKAEASLKANPIFLTVLGGCDAWPVAQSVDFFGRAHEMAKQLGTVASFETHRSRSFFNPWTTRDILSQLPELRLTCDFSHWCCVCERLIDTEPDVLALCAERAYHIHGRVGYEQGPQVPHPAAPEFAPALAAHERWWSVIAAKRMERGEDTLTITPEFGPDGYLHTLPFTETPVAALDEINRWMASRLAQRFGKTAANEHRP